MEELNSLYARFRRGAHTSPTEPLNAPCNRCREWHGSTRNTCVKRVDRCFFRAHHGGHGRCGTQRGRTTGFTFVQTLGQRRIPKLWFKVCAQPVLPLGEMILARRPGAHLQKSQTHFVCGCCLGRDSHTDEHTVVAGVFRTRAVRRLTEDRIWSAEAIADMDWTPWRTAERTRGRLRKAAVTMNVPIWNMHFCRPYQALTVNHHWDLPEPRLGWRREVEQRRHQMPRQSPRNLVLCTRGRLCDRRTRVLRNNHEWTIQRCLTQEARSHHLLAFRCHPPLLRHPRHHWICLERRRK